MPERRPTYTREEMDAILKRALERQQEKAEEIGHEDLVAAAGEVGIPREDVEAAARDLEAEKAKKEAAARPPAPSPEAAGRDGGARARGLRRLGGRAATTFGLSAFFILIAQQTGTGNWWIWPVLGMGLALFFHATRILFGDPPMLTERHEAHVSRRERKRRRREEALVDFERKVAIGTDALLRVIDEAKRVKDRVDAAVAAHDGPARRAPAEPREPRDQGPRVLVTPPPVRVDTREPDAVERGDDGRTSASSRRAK